jgi:hypothetical protein
VIAALEGSDWDVAAAAKKTGEKPRYVKKWKEQWLLHRTIADRKRTGRKPALTKTQQDALAVLLAEEQTVSKVRAVLIEQHGLPASTSLSTLYRAAKKQLDLAAPVKQPLLTKAGRDLRVSFAEKELDSNRDWGTVMAIDSTYFTLNGTNPKRKYWVKKGHKVLVHKPNKAQQLHAYAGISIYGKTPLFFVTGTTGLNTNFYNSKGEKLRGVGAEEFQEMMEKQLLPAAEQIFAAAGVADWALLLDRAPAHTAKSTKQFLAAKGIRIVEDWPGNSPDLNPIENAWGVTKQQVHGKQYTKLDDLKEAACNHWDALSTTALRNLMLSIPRRLKKVLKLNGGYTGY